jgi:hypothetical protein
MLLENLQHLTLGLDVYVVEDSSDLGMHAADLTRVPQLILKMDSLEYLRQGDGLRRPGQTITSISPFASLDDIGVNKMSQHPPHENGVGLEAERHCTAGAQPVGFGQDHQCLNCHQKPPRTVEISHEPSFSPSHGTVHPDLYATGSSEVI